MSDLDKLRLNLGCGRDKRTDWLNVDASEAVDPDLVVDLEKTPWPFETGQFEVVEARHVLEHLEVVPWDEIERVMKPGATLKLIYPIGYTRFEDPTHKQYWNWDTAENIGGEKKHSHELGLNLRLVYTEYEGCVTADVFTKLYTKYRKLIDGPGPWIEQVPGFSGERIAVYRFDP